MKSENQQISQETYIQSPLLNNIGGYIAGQWTQSVSGNTRTVINPATGALLAEVPHMSTEETTLAIESGRQALTVEIDLQQRKYWLQAIHDKLLENKEELGRIITLEQGKPLKESLEEIEYSAGFFGFYADALHALVPHELDTNSRGCRWRVYLRPAGVVGLLSTWNFPIAMLSKKLAPALGAGCSIVAKPASVTPLTMIAFWNLIEELKIPSGKINLVLGSGSEVGKILCEHPEVRVISCTGSTETGQALLRNSAEHIKRLSLELGGNAPFIIFDDADLEATAKCLMVNKFRCAGQTCVCTNRVFVHKSVEDEFLGHLIPLMKTLKVGNGMKPGTNIGPLINKDGFLKVRDHVTDALAKGGERLLGDDPPEPQEDWGCFYPPTLIKNANESMCLFQEETFGPVVAITTFDTEAEVIRRANDTKYGLAAYVFSQDKDRGLSICSMLKFGHVGLNTATGPTPEAPFGGMKQSGFGREGGSEGLMEFVETQVIPEG